MFDREKDLLGAFAARRLSRRELLTRTGYLGLSTGAAAFLLAMEQSNALAADFDWKKHKNSQVKLLLNKHPYSDALIANLQAFRDLTGIDVVWEQVPEDIYFDRVAAALSTKSSDVDAFMSGVYMNWTYGAAGWLVDLNDYLKDPTKTHPTYNWDDVLPNLRAATAWDGVPGSALGTGESKQWGLPLGYEVYSLTYNRRLLEKAKLAPPSNLQALAETAAKLAKDENPAYGFGVRGSRSWATIHPGFMSAYANFGEKDFTVSNGKLKAAMNSAGSKSFHRDWIKLVQEAGPDAWADYTWFELGNDLVSGAAAMVYDADILGYFMNGSEGPEKGNLASAAFTPNAAAASPTSNLWVWSLSMNSASKHQDATWYFVQWATAIEHGLFGARKKDVVNPVRTSVWRDAEFQAALGRNHPGYADQLERTVPGAKVQFSAHPQFFEITTLWAASLQQMVAKELPVDEALDRLAVDIDKKLVQAGLG